MSGPVFHVVTTGWSGTETGCVLSSSARSPWFFCLLDCCSVHMDNGHPYFIPFHLCIDRKSSLNVLRTVHSLSLWEWPWLSGAVSCCRAEATLMSFTSYHLPSFSLRPGSEEAGNSAVHSFTSWGWKLFKAPNRSEELLIPSWWFRMKIFLFYLVFERPFNFLGQSGFQWSSQSDKCSLGWKL